NNFQARRNERALEHQRAVEAYELKMQKVHEAEARMTAKITGSDRPTIQVNLEKASKGDARAMADAGFQYLFAIEVPLDRARGLSMIEDAANHGDARSMHNLAFWYRTGKDGIVAPDLERANVWLRKAAAAGDVEAMAALGAFLQAGNGIAADLVEALKWDTIAAKQGNPIAAENAAVMLTGGFDGITPDPERAEAYYRQAIAAGSKTAGDNLLTLLANMERAEDNTATLSKAFKLRLELAQTGDPVHEAMVGLYYRRGYVGPVDLPKAIEWFNRAAQHGSARALYELAFLYDEGAPGVPVDQAKALGFYRQAAVQGFPEAVYVMGYRIFEGMGIQQDEIEGERLLRLAANSGHSIAPRILAQIYTDGLGVEPDRAEAIKWLRLGVERGDAQCTKLLEAALAQPPTTLDRTTKHPASTPSTPVAPVVATTPTESVSKPGAMLASSTRDVHLDSVKGYDDALKQIRDRILGLGLRKHDRGDGTYTMLAALYAEKKAANPTLSEHDYVLALHDKAAAGSKEEGYLFGAARLCGFGIRTGPGKELAGYIGAMLDSGKPEVLRDYGILLLHGKGVGQDEAKGFSLIKQAADAGLTSAQALAGELLFFGVGTAENREAGIAIWKKSAEGGDNWGGFNYAQASKQDHPEISLHYFKRGAEAGDDRSMFFYGWFIETGRATTADEAEGTKWIERAATAGNPRAQGMMGTKHAEGRGVTEDATVACLYWEIGARHGDMAAQL
ncbi:MAG: SEL1-like repeat protein, partial [Lacunisphaera sp.]